MAVENESITSSLAGPNGTKSPANSPADVLDMSAARGRMPRRIRIDRRAREKTGPTGTWVDVSRTSQWRCPWMPAGVRNWLRSVNVTPHETMLKTKQVCNYNYALWLQHGVPVTMPSMRRKLLAELPSLRGLDLACDCPLDSPCHADVLLALANGMDCDPVTWLSAKAADA